MSKIETRKCDICGAVLLNDTSLGWLIFEPRTIIKSLGADGAPVHTKNVEDVCSLVCFHQALSSKTTP